MTDYDDEIIVTLPSGAPFPVLNEDEEQFLNDKMGMYTSTFKFENVSDLGELDRVITFELLVYRYGVWLGRRADYDGKPVDERDLRKDLKDASLELRQVKKALGIDKVTRDKERGEGSLHEYKQKLLQRAKQLGIHREHQLDFALELMNQTIGLLNRHKNATPEEQREFRCSESDLIDWMWTVMKPEFEAIDAHFRANTQRYWVQEQ